MGPVLRHHAWDIREKVSICFWCSPAVWRAWPSNQPWHMFNIRRNRFPLNSGKNYHCFTSQSFELTTLANVPARMDAFNSLSGLCGEGLKHIWLDSGWAVMLLIHQQINLTLRCWLIISRHCPALHFTDATELTYKKSIL